MTTFELTPFHELQSAVVDIQPLADGLYQVTFEETAYNLVLHWETSEEGWARDTGTGKIYRFYCHMTPESIALWLGGRQYHFQRPQPKSRRSGGGAGGALLGSGEIKAPMPGTVLKILVESGQKVETNAPLVVMESMKMEMTLTAPGAGVVKQVLAEVGQLVEMNSVLVRMESETSDV